MANVEKVDRGLYRVENKDGSVSWMIDYLNPEKKSIRKTFGTKKQAVAERATCISLMAKGEYGEFVKKRKNYNKTLKVQFEYVFTYQGESIKDVKTALKNACKDAGIPYGRNVPDGITFHDLRHSYGSYLMVKGVDIRTTQELLGHRNLKMAQRYTHMGENTKKRAVNSLDWNLHEKKFYVS